MWGVEERGLPVQRTELQGHRKVELGGDKIPREKEAKPGRKQG